MQETEWYRIQMLNQLWLLGGVSLPFYSYYLKHLSLFDEGVVKSDTETIRDFDKNSLDAKETNLTLALIPVGSN